MGCNSWHIKQVNSIQMWLFWGKRWKYGVYVESLKVNVELCNWGLQNWLSCSCSVVYFRALLTFFFFSQTLSHISCQLNSLLYSHLIRVHHRVISTALLRNNNEKQHHIEQETQERPWIVMETWRLQNKDARQFTKPCSIHNPKLELNTIPQLQTYSWLSPKAGRPVKESTSKTKSPLVTLEELQRWDNLTV